MKKIIYSLLTLVLSLSSCQKFLDIVPVGQVIPKLSSEYRGLLTTAYESFPEHRALLSMRGIQIYPLQDEYGLSGFASYKDIYTWVDNENSQGYTEEFPYFLFYRVIFYCNDIIDKGLSATPVAEEPREQVVAEAHTLRAYSYFEMLNMFGPKYSPDVESRKLIPLYQHIDTEQTFPLKSIGELYREIFDDLDAAEKLMKVPRYTDSTLMYRFCEEGLYALRSRVHLYREEWQKALTYAQKALTLSTYLEDLNTPEGLLPTRYYSKENICALEKVVNSSTREYSALSEEYMKSFEKGDLRASRYFANEFVWFTDSTAWLSLKYPDLSYRCTIRRAEVYLNAAEAAAHLGQEAEARRLLSVLIRHRYTPEQASEEVSKVNALTGEPLLKHILLERTREFGAEGFDFYDYKRTTQPALSKVIDGKTYTLSAHDPRYQIPIPYSARKLNPGYQDK